MSQIVLAILGVVLGAWVNNIFTWKIKNRIDALDDTYKDALNLNTKFSDFIVDSNDHSNPNSGYVDSENMASIQPKIDIYINNLYLYCFIIDGEKAGEFYSNIVRPWVNFIADTINGSNFATAVHVPEKFKKAYIEMLSKHATQTSDIALEYIELFNIVQESIMSQRVKLTSFCYMLKECNPLKIVCAK